MIQFPFSKKTESLLVEALQNHKVFVFPTETIYGLGGNAFSKSAVERVYEIKGRSRTKSFLLIINLDWLDQICCWSDSRINDLIDSFWPGPFFSDGAFPVPENPRRKRACHYV